MGFVSDILVCGWNYLGIFLDELRKTHETQNYVQAQRNLHTAHLRRETSYY